MAHPTPGFTDPVNNTTFMQNSKNTTLIVEPSHGLLSPQPKDRKEGYDFYPDTIERMGSPALKNSKQLVTGKSPVMRSRKKKSNTFKLKKDQE